MRRTAVEPRETATKPRFPGKKGVQFDFPKIEAIIADPGGTISDSIVRFDGGRPNLAIP